MSQSVNFINVFRTKVFSAAFFELRFSEKSTFVQKHKAEKILFTIL